MKGEHRGDFALLVAGRGVPWQFVPHSILSSSLYYFQIQLHHLLAPFPFWRPLIPLSVALLRCVSFTLARMKNSRRILVHFYLEIVLYNKETKFRENRRPRRRQPKIRRNHPANRLILCYFPALG